MADRTSIEVEFTNVSQAQHFIRFTNDHTIYVAEPIAVYPKKVLLWTEYDDGGSRVQILDSLMSYELAYKSI